MEKGKVLEDNEGELLKKLLEAIPNPACLISKDRRILAQNKATEKIIGTKVGCTCWGSIHGTASLSEDAKALLEKYGESAKGIKCRWCRAEEALAEGIGISEETEYMGRYWETWWIPVGEDMYLHYIIDITKYKLLEKELMEKEKYLEILLSSIPAGVLIIDAEKRRVEGVNEEALLLIGAEKGDVIGKNCNRFFDCKRCILKRDGITSTRFETVLYRINREKIPIIKSIRRVLTDNGEKLIEAFIDITDRKKLEEELYKLSITDPLTGAYNYRHFHRKLQEEIDRTRRTGRKFSLIIYDMDDFKNINDRYGHNVGDMILIEVVRAVKKRIRKIDVLARWGGEEFIILLPNTRKDDAVKLANDLRDIMASIKIPNMDRISASFGVVEYVDGDTPETITSRVDKLMYEAKARGKNCVVY
ncbi:diguanylate cyclase [Thermovorax subterraneus]|nr:diguanylate cyclase [Thermovorax subterraneus]